LAIQDLVGEGYLIDIVDDVAHQEKDAEANLVQGKDLGYDRLSKKSLKQLQADIGASTRPSYHRPPPSNLGEAAAGKLKAEEWKSAIEWDIPVSLMQMWSVPDNLMPADERTARRQKVSEGTILLATAIRWATSHRTSEEHVNKYIMYVWWDI